LPLQKSFSVLLALRSNFIEKRASHNTESFVDFVELGVVKLPELQDQYQNLKTKSKAFDMISRLACPSEKPTLDLLRN